LTTFLRRWLAVLRSVFFDALWFKLVSLAGSALVSYV
jgi:hypothetical protein